MADTSGIPCPKCGLVSIPGGIQCNCATTGLNTDIDLAYVGPESIPADSVYAEPTQVPIATIPPRTLCKHCGGDHEDYMVCPENPIFEKMAMLVKGERLYTDKELNSALASIKPDTGDADGKLIALYNELGTLDWSQGEEPGWYHAIEAVRRHILGVL